MPIFPRREGSKARELRPEKGGRLLNHTHFIFWIPTFDNQRAVILLLEGLKHRTKRDLSLSHEDMDLPRLGIADVDMIDLTQCADKLDHIHDRMGVRDVECDSEVLHVDRSEDLVGDLGMDDHFLTALFHSLHGHQDAYLLSPPGDPGQSLNL